MNFLADSLQGFMDLHMNTGAGGEGRAGEGIHLPSYQRQNIALSFWVPLPQFSWASPSEKLGCMCTSLWGWAVHSLQCLCNWGNMESTNQGPCDHMPRNVVQYTTCTTVCGHPVSICWNMKPGLFLRYFGSFSVTWHSYSGLIWWKWAPYTSWPRSVELGYKPQEWQWL